MRIFGPTRGRSPRWNVALNPQNPQKPDVGWTVLMYLSICKPFVCLCVCVSVRAYAGSSLEPQLNLSDISSHVLFPHYKGPTVTHRVREWGLLTPTQTHTYSLARRCAFFHAHTHTSDTHQRERAGEQKQGENKLNRVQDRPFIIITIFNKTQIRYRKRSSGARTGLCLCVYMCVSVFEHNFSQA